MLTALSAILSRLCRPEARRAAEEQDAADDVAIRARLREMSERRRLNALVSGASR